MQLTPRGSTIPNDQQLEQKAALYAELHPDGPPPKRRRPAQRLRRAVRGLRGENRAS